MVNPPRLLFDLERADRVTRSVASTIEHCSRLREQQRSLLTALRANLGHIQSANESGNSMLEALRKGGLPKASPTERGADGGLTSGADFARFRLTAREAQVAELLALGRSNVAVAKTLGISEHTARHHTESVLAKLGVRSRAEAGALVRGWIAPPSAGTAA
jgi:DNA-binding CsgD family transcriptional regulator